VDEGALEIARRAAAEAGVAAAFARADVADPPERGAFDIAFARLLVSHLTDPMAAIRGMRDAVRPGGVVAVEDPDTFTLRAEPPAPALDRLAAVYAATRPPRQPDARRFSRGRGPWAQPRRWSR
jgi:2-polyprenyl-3-methyl-5-hydroxy-6-metoxy-1,4-benzoquinol methylase